MKRFLFLNALFIFLIAPVKGVLSARDFAQEPPSYPLICRGGPDALIFIRNERRLAFKFKKGSGSAGSGLAPGECSWQDRAVREAEPDTLVQRVKEGRDTDPEYQWIEALKNPDTYWVFDVYNDGQGQFRVTGSRLQPGSKPLAKRPDTFEPPSIRRTPAPRVQPAERSSADDRGTPTVSGLVNWSYFRMNNVAVLEAALRGVNEGKLSSEAIKGSTNIADGGSKSNTGLMRRADRIPIRPELATNPATSVADIPLSDIEYTPTALEMGSVYDGNKLQRSIFLTSPTDGDVQARVPAGTPFRIVSLIAYNGSTDATDPARSGLASPQSETLRAVSMAPAILGVSARVDNPPFTLTAKSGQQLRAIVVFEPRLASGNSAGPYGAKIMLSGSRWHLSVPASATFKGLNVGPWAIVTEPDLDVIAPPGGAMIAARAPIKLINGGPAAKCSFTAEELPNGVTMSPLALSLGENTRSTAELNFNIDLSRAAVVAGQSVVVRLDWSGGSRLYYLNINLFPSFYHWGWNGEVGGLGIAYDMSIYGDGSFHFYYSANNENPAVVRDFKIRFYVDGTELANVSGRAGRLEVVHSSFGWVQGYIRENYGRLVRGKASHWIKVDTHF